MAGERKFSKAPGQQHVISFLNEKLWPPDAMRPSPSMTLARRNGLSCLKQADPLHPIFY
ncbi:hypothetical protein PO124_13055 [Bacillus licheniformis]|nr:hypothetical protein [Bacillus licheniformis]